MTLTDPLACQRVHAFGDDALGDHDGVALAGLFRSGKVSARELAEAAIARLEKANPELNGIVLATADRLLADADRADRELRSPSTNIPLPYFAGVPGLVKDNSDVAGLPTRHGSYATPAGPAKADDKNVQQYLGQGFGLLGKTTLPEFGLHGTTERRPDPDTGQPTAPTRNPWNLARIAGGSSGGAAALTSAGVVPIAHANDGGGSIRIPAACCGLVGLKPTRGRMQLSRFHAQAPIKVVADGVVTRSVRDTARYFAEAERWTPSKDRSRNLPLIGLVEGPGAVTLRIGVCYDSLPGIPSADAQAKAAVEQTAELLAALGHQVEETVLPVGEWFHDSFLAYWQFLAWSMAVLAPRMYGYAADRYDDLLYGLAGSFQRDKRKQTLACLRLGALAGAHRLPARGAWRMHDVLLTPVLNAVPPEIGWLSPTVPYETLIERLISLVAFTPLANVEGNPAVSLPCGLSLEGVPTSVMLSAPYGQERRLLELAYAVEEARPFPKITA
ncbi:amidase [Segniliparus rugosus]|uniref:amidase n=1 Tax=Segniliparus rugosus (strain ATCC BAA-974 / DSM 45345 / CCUG 50838 / CIP 108380 / JCM 13579 / CDC 945) TaxID=679197 RepID=E5XUX9_SEGRC|nr:amidase [Segniliparus rugosus]EFV11815.1 hypothetical protein HMPREF9336_03301 [Segniliparus rugosus ATCC BAA-974]